MNAPIVINNTAISTNSVGLYRLNDIHACSPVAALKHKAPNKWADGAGADVIQAAESQTPLKGLGTKSSTYEVIHGGAHPGTYASKELVYAYAMWLSPEFMLHVISVFDAVVTGQIAPPIPYVQPPMPLQDTMAAMLMLGEAIGRVPGVNPAIATAAALTMIKDQTGIDTEPMRRCLPTANGPRASMNPTQLGEVLGVSARGVNRALELAGMQQRNARGDWELTVFGKEHGESLPYVRNGHSGYQILWQEETLRLLGCDDR